MARFAVLVAILLLFSAAPARAGGDDADLRKQVRSALRERDATERARQLERALDGANSAAAATLVFDTVLARAETEVEVTVGIFALAAMTDSKAVALIGARTAKGTLLERTRAIEAVGRSDARGAGSELLPLTGDPSPRIRAAAATALGERHQPGLDDALADALQDPHWTVKSAAITALARQGRESAVPLLCTAMRRVADPAEGRLVDDCTSALVTLTGQRFGADPERYEAWWAARQKQEGAPAPPAAEPWQAPPRSFLSPLVIVRSRRVLFVLCTGETMKDPIDAARIPKVIRDSVARAGADLGRKLETSRTKLDVAQVHLRAMIRTLEDGVRFDVMTYASSAGFAFGKMTSADAAARRKAEGRIARLSPSGGGNLGQALRKVFDPKDKDALGAPDGPDTVILFSDGHLREPGNTDRLEVSTSAVRPNRARQIRFVVVSVGQSDQSVLGPLAGGPPKGTQVRIP